MLLKLSGETQIWISSDHHIADACPAPHRIVSDRTVPSPLHRILRPKRTHRPS
jgi:hypothetical protein